MEERSGFGGCLKKLGCLFLLSSCLCSGLIVGAVWKLAQLARPSGGSANPVSTLGETFDAFANIAGDGEVGPLLERARQAAPPFDAARPQRLTPQRLDVYLAIRGDMRPHFDSNREQVRKMAAAMQKSGLWDLGQVLEFAHTWGQLRVRHARALVDRRMSADEYQFVSSRIFATVGPVAGMPGLDDLPAVPGLPGLPGVGGSGDEAALLRSRAAQLGPDWLTEEMLLTTEFGRFFEMQEGLPNAPPTAERTSPRPRSPVEAPAVGGEPAAPTGLASRAGEGEGVDASGGAVLLRWKFAPARRRYQHVLEQKVQAEGLKMETLVALDVTDTVSGGGGVGKVLSSFDRVRVTSAGLLGDESFDSASGRAPGDSLIVAPFAVLAGRSLTIDMTELGEVTAVAGAAELQRDMQAAAGGLPLMIEGTLAQRGAPLPANPVRPRASWLAEARARTPFGTMEGKKTYFYQGIADRRGHRCAKIKFVTAYGGEAMKFFEEVEATADELDSVAADLERQLEHARADWAGEEAPAAGPERPKTPPRGNFPSQGTLYFDIDGGYPVELIVRVVDGANSTVFTMTLMP